VDERQRAELPGFDAVESLATNAGARVLAIGNPDDGAAHFASICKPGSGWHVIRVNGFETPNFTDEQVSTEVSDLLLSTEWVEERKKRWGESSRSTRARSSACSPKSARIP
jgi:hypothetical protein